MAKRSPAKTKRSPTSGKKILLWAAGAAVPVLVLLLALVPVLSPQTKPDTFPHLEVAGYRIGQEEYLQAMYQARNDVLSDHAAAGISLKSFQERTPLGDPCELVTQRTLEILCEYYAVSTLAVERGQLSDASYDAMLRDMEDLNRQRQEALSSGGIFTGLPHFTPADYMTYRASNLRILFTNDPNAPENQVTQNEILARYEADKADLYALPDDLELSYLVINTDPEEADALAPELEKLRQLALQKGDLVLALEEMPQLKDHYQEISVDQGNYSIYARSHGDILACAEQLQTGDISQVFRSEGWLCLVQCRHRTQHMYTPLEDVESLVVQSIRESRYDALISQRMEEMKIDADLQALLRFTAEQFN